MCVCVCVCVCVCACICVCVCCECEGKQCTVVAYIRIYVSRRLWKFTSKYLHCMYIHTQYTFRTLFVPSKESSYVERGGYKTCIFTWKRENKSTILCIHNLLYVVWADQRHCQCCIRHTEQFLNGTVLYDGRQGEGGRTFAFPRFGELTSACCNHESHKTLLQIVSTRSRARKSASLSRHSCAI